MYKIHIFERYSVENCKEYVIYIINNTSINFSINYNFLIWKLKYKFWSKNLAQIQLFDSHYCQVSSPYFIWLNSLSTFDEINYHWCIYISSWAGETAHLFHFRNVFPEEAEKHKPHNDAELTWSPFDRYVP